MVPEPCSSRNRDTDFILLDQLIDFTLGSRKPDRVPNLRAQVNLSGNQRQLIRVCLKRKDKYPTDERLNQTKKVCLVTNSSALTFDDSMNFMLSALARADMWKVHAASAQ